MRKGTSLLIIYSLFLIVNLFSSSCKKDSSISPEIVIPNEISEEVPTGFDTLKENKLYLLENIQYGSNILNTLDICLPINRSISTPVIIFIHGGGWVSDDKFFYHSDIQEFADSGFACVSINYRFADTLLGINLDNILADVDSALLFVVNNAPKLKISNSRIGISGYSAGAHLALMTSYRSTLNGCIKACASISGPTDLVDSTQRRVVGWFNWVIKNAVGIGLNSYSDTVLYKSKSPFWNINLNCKPTLLVHGMQDSTILARQSINLQQKLNDNFIYNSLLLLPNKDHGIWNDSRYKTFQWFKQRL